MTTNLNPPPSELLASHPPRCELLAPAGEWSALRAAVANGADAVYFGLERFNARGRAANFATDELPAVLEHLHERNVRGYVTLNTLIFSDELADAARCVEACATAGADALIVQDLGLLRLARRIAPTLPLHVSTQMTQTEAGGIAQLAAWGVSRVIVARELTLDELRLLATASPLPLEVFVHGALCISYSGQCLASATLLERSANRGRCAQACRLPYQLIVDGARCDLGPRSYLLSPQDLAGHEHVADLVRLGVAALKIEGRQKDAAYVAAATRAYRAALDAALAAQPFALSTEQAAELAQGFARGSTSGYLAGVDHQRLVIGRAPGSRGTFVGTVVDHTRRGVVVALATDESDAARATDAAGAPAAAGSGAAGLKPGDGIVFDTHNPAAPAPGGRLYGVAPAPGAPPFQGWGTDEPGAPPFQGWGTDEKSRARAGRRSTPGQSPSPEGLGHPSDARRVELVFAREAFEPSGVPVGSLAWKTDDPAIQRRLLQSFARDVMPRRVALHATVRAAPDAPLVLTLTDDAGPSATVQSSAPLAAAERHPLTVELLNAQLGRLGDTPYALADIALHGPAGLSDAVAVMAPKSLLNDLRRQAVAELRRQRVGAASHVVVPDALPAERAASPAAPVAARPVPPPVPRLHVLVRTAAQLASVLAWQPPAGIAAGLTYVESDPGEAAGWLTHARAAGKAVAVATPRVLMPGEEGLLAALVACAPAAVLVRNLAALHWLRTHAPQLPLIGDASLNVANEIAAAALLAAGLRRWTPASELTAPQMASALEYADPTSCEVVAFQHVPLFHTRYCLAAAHLASPPHAADAAPCAVCGQPCRTHDIRLRDRYGVEHPVRADSAGRSSVYLSTPRGVGVTDPAGWDAAALAPLRRRGVVDFRIELLDEPAEQTALLLATTTAALSELIGC